MLPTVSQTREPIERNNNDLDSLLSELNTPKEIINNSPPGTKQPGTGSNFQSSFPERAAVEGEGLAEPVEQMPAEVAALSGKTIANTIDTALGTGMSLYAKNTTPEKYQATEKQIHNLESAWAAVAAKYNYRVEDSPWFNVILLTVAVYLPHFQEAKNDRRFALVDERITETEARLKRLEEMEQAKSAVAQPVTHTP